MVAKQQQFVVTVCSIYLGKRGEYNEKLQKCFAPSTEPQNESNDSDSNFQLRRGQLQWVWNEVQMIAM